MKYVEAKKLIESELSKRPEGLTWKELRDRLDLPYKTFCPEWTKALEAEIGLVRQRQGGRAYVWSLGNGKGS